MRLLAALLLCASAAQAAGDSARVAVMDFAASPADKDRAKGLSGVVSARLASYGGVQVVGFDEIGAALGLEKQKQALGCTEESCLQELSGALGVRYLVHGRLDRFGTSALLTAFLFDSRAAKGLVRFSQKVDDDAQLVGETERFAPQAAAALGLTASARPANALQPPPADTTAPAAAAPLVPDFHLNLKLGNTLASLKGASVTTYNVTFDLEGDYYFTPRWQAFLQATITIGSASDTTGTTSETSKSFRLFSPYAGAKCTFRPLEHWRPYLSLGVGLSFINKLFQTSTGDTVGLNALAVAGLAWIPFSHVGFNVEAGVNLSGVSSDGSGLYFGFKTNFGVIALF